MATTKTETSSGFSLQPDLFNKIYDDSKYAVKERNRKNEIEKKRAENEKRRKEEEKKKEKEKREKEKNKPMTRGEKIGYTIFLCILTLVSVPLSIYFSASLLNKLRKANGKDADLAVKLPTDPESKPYTNKSRSQVNSKKASDSKSFSSAISDSQKGGRRKKRHQRGGNNTTGAGGEASAASSSFSVAAPVAAAANEAKGFTDTTKYGVPYSLAANDNPIMADFGQYFITYFSFVRGIGVKAMEVLNDSFFKNFDPEKGRTSTSIGDKLIDWGVIAFVLPFLVSITTAITWLAGTISLFWSAINNQSIGMIPWLIFACCTFFFGGNWPTNLLVLYKDIYLASSGSTSNMNTFREYFSRYKFWWTFIIIALWGLWIYGFMGGGFGKKITKEPDFQIWMWAGCYTPLICLLIGILGFAAFF